MSTHSGSGTEDALKRTAEALAASFANSFVTPLRAATASLVLHGVQYVSIVVPASSGQVVSVANLAVAGPLHMTLLHSSQCAAGHTLQHRWAFTSSLFSHFRDIQAFPEAAQAAALMCHPLLATNPSPAHETHGLLRAHSAPNLQQMSSTMEATPLKGVQREYSVVLGSPQAQDEPRWLLGAKNKRRANPEEAAKPPVIGAMLLGFNGSKTPRKRDVEMLANVLGPLIAPLAGRAGDVASAAYLARTLSRLPPSLASLPADYSPDQSRADAEGMSGGGCSTDGMRRAATDTWILSIGERALLHQLLNDSSLTQRSISALPWRGHRSPMMSPLMSSMDVASRRDCASAKFTFTPCMPLVDPPEGSQGLSPRGSQQRSLSANWLSGEWAVTGDATRAMRHLIATGEPQSGFFADGDGCAAASFCSSPAPSGGRTILLGEGESVAAAASFIENPFASARGPPTGGSPPGQPPPPTWSAATAARWGHPAPEEASLLEGAGRSAPVRLRSDDSLCQEIE